MLFYFRNDICDINSLFGTAQNADYPSENRMSVETNIGKNGNCVVPCDGVCMCQVCCVLL